MTVEELYYNKILEVIRDYLGPAAERFVSRQIQTHLHKDPIHLQKSDIPTLAIRIRSGLMVLTRDEAVVEEAYQRLSSLADHQ
jgi:hypothetical protein